MVVGAGEQVRAWRPPLDGVREVFHARFVDYAYPPHTHDAWTVLLVDEGAVRYRLERHDHGSYRSVVTVLPPHVTHDGRSAVPDGFRKQVLYLERPVLGDEHIGRAVDDPTVRDGGLAGGLRRLHRTLADRHAEPLEAEARLAFAVERLRAHLDARPGGVPRWAAAPGTAPGASGAGAAGAVGGRGATAALAADLRDLLDTQAGGPAPTLAEMARTLGASPTHLVRAFTATFGVPPHAYLVGRRVDAARRLILDGVPPAEVAAATGFHDQPHLNRHFRRYVGTTPGRFRAAPDTAAEAVAGASRGV